MRGSPGGPGVKIPYSPWKGAQVQLLVREVDPIYPKLRTLVAQPNKLKKKKRHQNKQLKILTGKGEGAGVLSISSCKLTIPWLVQPAVCADRQSQQKILADGDARNWSGALWQDVREMHIALTVCCDLSVKYFVIWRSDGLESTLECLLFFF